MEVTNEVESNETTEKAIEAIHVLHEEFKKEHPQPVVNSIDASISRRSGKHTDRSEPPQEIDW